MTFVLKTHKMRRLLSCLFLIAVGVPCGLSIEINPSKERLKPERGPRPYLFQGDPRRVDRANTVQLRDVDLNLWVDPESVQSGGKINVTMSVFNKGRRPIMLLFPDSQRLEVAIVNDEGKEVYLHSARRRFDQFEGTTVINRRERVVFTATIPASGWSGGVRGGRYLLVAALAGYPHVQTQRYIEVR